MGAREPSSIITDHALLRWIERVHGVDVEKLRGQVEQACAPFLQAGVTQAQVGAVWMIARGGRVTTFAPSRPLITAQGKHESAGYRLPPADGPVHWKNRTRKRRWR